MSRPGTVSRHCLTVALSLAVAASVPASASAAEKPAPTIEPRFDLGFMSAAVSPEAGARLGMGARGYGLELGGGVLLHRTVSLTAEFGAQWHSDAQPFWEDTTAGDMKSSVGTYQLSLLVGLHSPDLKLGSNKDGAALAAVIKAGHTGFGGNRGISNCSNCSSESIDVKGGFVVEPTLVLRLRGRLGLGASYRLFSDAADFRNGFFLRFGYL